MEFIAKSATYAMKGKQLLHQNGIRAYVGKRSGDNGCFYYLIVADKKKDAAKTILEDGGVLKP